MYFTGDEKAAVKEIQQYLLSYYYFIDSDIDRVAVDGIYGEETKNSVIKYQKIKGLQESGKVDLSTFNSLRNDYIIAEEKNKADKSILSKKTFPLKSGNIGKDVLILNLHLSELREKYNDIMRVKKDIFFSSETENAVRDMQRIFLIEENGIVDAVLFERLEREVEAIYLANEKYN